MKFILACALSLIYANAQNLVKTNKNTTSGQTHADLTHTAQANLGQAHAGQTRTFHQNVHQTHQLGHHQQFPGHHQQHPGHHQQRPGHHEKHPGHHEQQHQGAHHLLIQQTQTNTSQQSTALQIDWSLYFHQGTCPMNVVRFQNLQPTKLSGQWFLQVVNDFNQQAQPSSCYHVLTNVNPDGTFTGREGGVFNNENWIGDVYTGAFSTVISSNDISDQQSQPAPVTVLDTDYSSYLITYECFHNGIQAIQQKQQPQYLTKVSIYSRKVVLDQFLINVLVNKVSSLVPSINLKGFIAVPQGGNCKYETLSLI